jgi:tetratricopeptide (TPR) repeat protein
MKRGLIGALLLAAATVGYAQVPAPQIIEEDLAPDEARQAAPTPPSEPAPKPAPAPAPPPAARPALAPAREPAVRPIEPVGGTYHDLLATWDERRRALREQDVPRAKEAEQRLLSLKRELGIENLFGMAESEARASARAREARLQAEAIWRAETAVALAPDLPDAHLALAVARAHAIRAPAQVLAALSELGAAVLAASREPHTARALLADILFAAMASAFITSVAVVALLFLRRARAVLHDVHHLPVLRLLTPVQAGFLGAVALLSPLAFDLGPFAFLAGLALASSAYLSRRERLVATAALAAVALLPWAARRSTAVTAWAGTLADDVYRLEQGADDGRVSARLEARGNRGALPKAALVALGRQLKRRGDLDEALRWYDLAGSERPDALVNAGNVHLLRGHADEAKASYLAAADRASDDTAALAAAHYDLSKIYLRQSALDQAREARNKAALEAPALIDQYGSDDDFRANRWLLDVPLQRAEIRRLAADDVPRRVGEAARAWLGGPLPRAAWPWAPLAAAALLWPLAALGRSHRHARVCERCGRPACTRCDGMTGDLCAQCVNVFSRKGVVEARDRVLKEAQVRRRARLRRLSARALAVAGGGAGYLWRGRPVRGALVLFGLLFLVMVAVSWRGVAPPPYPSGWTPWAKLAIAGPLAIAGWVFSVRDVFRGTRR